MTTKERFAYIAFQLAAGAVLGLMWSGCVFLMGYFGLGLG